MTRGDRDCSGQFSGKTGGGLRRIILTAILGLLSQTVSAGSGQDKAFNDALWARCQDASRPYDGTPLEYTCNNAFKGGLAGGVFGTPSAVSTNIGTSGIQGTTSQSAAQAQKRKEEKKEKGGGASADFHFDRLGFMISAQSGETSRKPTDLENGFDSDLNGLMVGVDYKFSDRFLVGLALGDSDNQATFRDGAGTLRSKMTSATLYLTYAPVDEAYLGAYVGTGRIRNSGTKKIVFGAISGIATTSNGGTQDVAGISGGYDWSLGSTSRLGGYLNIDSSRTRMNGYTEAGTTGLELIQPAQSMDSQTATLGMRISAAEAFDWGTLMPEFRLASVREYRNNARTITTALAADPLTQLQVSTDAPDRSYYLVGLGANFELGNRTRWFLDYEKRNGHSFLSTWAASAGIIIGF